jgi:hypothetical protein
MFLDIIHRPVFYLKHTMFRILDSVSVFRLNVFNWAQSIDLVGNERHKYNLTKHLFEKSELAQHAYEEGQKLYWNEAKVLQIEPTGNTRNPATCL